MSDSVKLHVGVELIGDGVLKHIWLCNWSSIELTQSLSFEIKVVILSNFEDTLASIEANKGCMLQTVSQSGVDVRIGESSPGSEKLSSTSPYNVSFWDK